MIAYKNGIYPYKIISDVAGIYTTVPSDLDYNDTITVRSKLHVIEYSGNIDYVKEKTLFE